MITANCFRYAKPVQLQELTGFSAKSFARWTSGSTSIPIEIAEQIAQQHSILVNELLNAWSNRREDAAVRKEMITLLQMAITRLNQERNHRYRQLKLPSIST